MFENSIHFLPNTTDYINNLEIARIKTFREGWNLDTKQGLVPRLKHELDIKTQVHQNKLNK